jgi:transposase
VLSLSELVRIYVCLTPTDMRKSFDSLTALVREGLGYDPLSGHLFVFRSRRGDRVKLLWWDRAPEVTGSAPCRSQPGTPCW